MSNLALKLSLLLNVVLLAVGVSVLQSSYLRWVLYERIAERFGSPEIAFMGDSITAFGFVWGPRIGQYNLNVRNFAKKGFTTGQMLPLVRDVSLVEPKACFIMAGINDIIRAEETDGENEEAKRNYRKIIDALIERKIVPVITLTLYRQNEPHPDSVDDLNRFLQALAKEKNLTVISLQEDLCENRSLMPAYTEDGLHLNKRAYKIWAVKIRQVLVEKGIADRNE